MTDSATFREKQETAFANGLHWCGRCKRFLPIAAFGRMVKARYGLRSECKECRRLYRAENADRLNTAKREQYHQDEGYRQSVRAKNSRWQENHREYSREYMRQRYDSLRQPFVALAGGKCSRCGYHEFTSGLDFHHVAPDEKDGSPSNFVNSGNYDAAYAELDKCILLCRNCHQALHARDWSTEFVKRDGFGWAIKTT